MKREPMSLTEAITIGWNDGMAFNVACKERQKKIAKRIRELRTENGYSQQKLAETINVNRLTYANYEQCKSEYRIDVLCRIAELFKVSMDYLCCMTENPTGRNLDEDSFRNEKIREIEEQIAELQSQVERLK